MANIFKFLIGSSAFAKRARRHLADFDEQRNAEADRLLRVLAELNPATEKPLTVTLRRSDDARAVFEYRPVPKALERAHSRMGALLHYTLFWQNPEWYMIDRSRRGSFDTLLDARDVVAEALQELTYVTRSSLLAHPTVSRRVIELEQEAAKEAAKDDERLSGSS